MGSRICASRYDYTLWNCPSVVAKIRLRGITDDIRSRNIKNEIAVKYPVS
jgi:hypothetical protein